MSEKKRPLKRTFIREWREYKGLTQVQLANRLEGVVGQSTLSRLERGDYAYTQPTLEAIAEALGCEPADLIGRLPGAPHELTLLVNKLSPEARKKAIGIIKVMVAAYLRQLGAPKCAPSICFRPLHCLTRICA